jgi:hypothetical protein
VFDLLEAESLVFPASRAANMELGKFFRLTIVTLGLDAAILLFTKLRSRASQLRICPWPPSPSDLAPVFLTFIEVIGLVMGSAPHCTNCRDTEHSTASCPHFPASFSHDAALGFAAPPATAGSSGSGKQGAKRPKRSNKSNKSNKPAAGSAATPPAGARPPFFCKYGAVCLNKLTTCKFRH